MVNRSRFRVSPEKPIRGRIRKSTASSVLIKGEGAASGSASDSLLIDSASPGLPDIDSERVPLVESGVIVSGQYCHDIPMALVANEINFDVT